MRTNSVRIPVAAAGAVGHALADLLARVGEYAERLAGGRRGLRRSAGRAPEHGRGCHPPSARVMTPEQVTRVLDTAVRAPSVHNTQPWQFEVDGDELRVHVDRSWQLSQQDPEGRELVLSCGAAVARASRGCWKPWCRGTPTGHPSPLRRSQLTSSPSSAPRSRTAPTWPPSIMPTGCWPWRCWSRMLTASCGRTPGSAPSWSTGCGRACALPRACRWLRSPSTAARAGPPWRCATSRMSRQYAPTGRAARRRASAAHGAQHRR